MTSQRAAEIMCLLSELYGYLGSDDRWGRGLKCKEASKDMRELSLELALGADYVKEGE